MPEGLSPGGQTQSAGILIRRHSLRTAKEVIGFDEIVWAKQRMDIVVTGNIHKFNQHPQFADYLTNTQPRVLLEASPVDKIWGIGLTKDAEGIENPYSWNGENLLGFALMEVRYFLTEFGHFENLTNAMLPPWKKYPGIHPYEIFWRMGGGEEYGSEFGEFFTDLSEREKSNF